MRFRASLLLCWVVVVALATLELPDLRAASTGGLVLGQVGSITSDPTEVVSGTRSIKGSYSGTATFTNYFLSDTTRLPLLRNQAYRITLRYKILSPNTGFNFLFYSPKAAAQNNFLPGQTISGGPGTTGSITLTNTLGSFDDYQALWTINSIGSIAIDDIQITNVGTGTVVAAEDAEPGTMLLSTFLVSASKPAFVWGESVKVAATLYDETGKPLTTGPVAWTVTPSSAASVAADGTVTPRALATFTVRGTAAATTGEVLMQALPKRIVVTPERTSMLVGSSQKMRADVMDMNDQPIPSAVVNWRLSSEYFDFTNSATIDSAGTLKAVLQAHIRVEAQIRYNQTVPGFDVISQGDTVVDIKAPTTYKFQRVFVAKSTGAATSTLAPRAAPLIPTETGGFMFAASLDGLGSALLEWNNGNVTPLLASGRANLVNGYPLADFLNYSRTSSGAVLVEESDLSGSSLVSSGSPGLITPLFASGSAIFGAQSTSAFDMTRNSAADSGALFLRVGYTDAVTHLFTTGLFRGFGRGVSEPVFNSRDSRIANGDAPGGIDVWGIANDGTAWFQTNGKGIWRSLPGQAVERMLGPGDILGGETVNSIASNFTTIEPTLFVAGNGDVINAISTNKGQRFLLWHDADTVPSLVLAVTTASGVYWYDPAMGALIDATLPGKPRGLYLWNSNTPKPLLLLNDASVDGSPVQEILSAAGTSDGTIYAMVRTLNSPMLIARLAPNPQVLLQAGDSVPVSVPPVITSLIPGARAGTPMVIAGGGSGSIARLDPSGAITPVVRVGTRLPDGKYFAGSKQGMVRTLTDGRIVFGHDYFASDSGLYTWNQGTIQLSVSPPLKLPDGSGIGSPNNVEINRQGDVAFQLGFNCCGIYRLRAGKVTTAIDGKSNVAVDGVTIQNPTLRGIDDSGNIMFTGNNPDGTGFYAAMWDGNATHLIMTLGQKMPDGRQVTSGGSGKACADGFVVGVLGTFARYRNGAWNYLADPSQPLATGAAANTLGSFNFDANRQCDVVFTSNNNGAQDLGARVGASYQEIQDLQQFTHDGELLSVSQMLINDDATIYVLGANDQGEEVLYLATPVTGTVEVPFSTRSSGGFSTTTGGSPSSPVIGYARVQSTSTVFGLAIFGNRQNGVLVSETAVPASHPFVAGRFYAELAGLVNTGVAIANPNNQAAIITYSLTRMDGTDLKSGVFTVDPNKQIASSLNQSPFSIGSGFTGTFSFSSSVPISVIALRENANARGELLISTLPVIDLNQQPSRSLAVLPDFATGGGWTTQIVLVNPTNTPLTGNVDFYSPGSGTAPGALTSVNAGGQVASSFTYQIPGRSSYKLATLGNESVTNTGSVRITPGAGQPTPASLALFSFTPNGVVVSEAGISGFLTTSTQMYAEASGVPFTAGSIQTEIVIANPSNQLVLVAVDLNRLDGTSAGFPSVFVSIPANGQVRQSVNELFPGLSLPFQGVVRLTTSGSSITSGSPVSVAALRGRTNERGDFLLTTTPPSPIGTGPSSDLFFPHLVDGGGYTTQIILIGNGSVDSAGVLDFVDQTGQPLSVTLH